MTREEREVEFLRLLTIATETTGIYIGGCGCCDSPYLGELSEEEKSGYYDSKKHDRVFWNIVK